jgi:hypothetical protein
MVVYKMRCEQGDDGESLGHVDAAQGYVAKSVICMDSDASYADTYVPTSRLPSLPHPTCCRCNLFPRELLELSAACACRAWFQLDRVAIVLDAH